MAQRFLHRACSIICNVVGSDFCQEEARHDSNVEQSLCLHLALWKALFPVHLHVRQYCRLKLKQIGLNSVHAQVDINPE